jgi:hypothetical protein
MQTGQQRTRGLFLTVTPKCHTHVLLAPATKFDYYPCANIKIALVVNVDGDCFSTENNMSLGIVFHFGRHVQPHAPRNISRPATFRSPKQAM